MDSKFKEPTINMKAVLLDLLDVVRAEDNGKAGQWRAVYKTHHMTLKAMAKQTYGCLIQLEAVYADSPAGIVWRVAITRYGLQVAKKLEKGNRVIHDTDINDDSKKKKKPRKLKTIQWQVNVNQDDGLQLYEDVKAMKKNPKQSFTRYMDGLFNMGKELRIGQVDLLQKLFPEAYATMLLITRNEIEMEGSGELRELIEEFKGYMKNQKALQLTDKPVSRVPAPPNGQSSGNSGLKGIQGQHVNMTAPPPDDDEDDDLELEIKKSTDNTAAKNFIAQMMSLVADNEDKPKADPKAFSGRQRAQKGSD